jgi:DNA-binding SARP family transcriptional activator/tetratricopeptide (TPR) repeat protein
VPSSRRSDGDQGRAPELAAVSEVTAHDVVGAFNAPALEQLPRIINSKIEAPPLRATTLTRHRLLARLPLGEPKRVTLIVGEPGFGKTTLLADFSSRYHGRCIWYRLDETDRDWVTMANYLIAATRTSDSDFGSATSALLVPITGATPSKHAVVSSLIYELQKLGDRPTAIVFDDFQAVEDSAEAQEFISRLMADAPSWFVFILSTRRRPTLPLARWASQGEVSEVSTDDLRFTAAEIERLFAEAYGQPLDPELIEPLDARTRGWAACLQLFHSLIQGKPPSAVRSAVRNLSGAASPVYELLAEEVLSGLSGHVAEFALRSAALEIISPHYVSAAFGDVSLSLEKAEAMMDAAEQAGIVSRASHASVIRQLHPLLKEFLARKLHETLSAQEIQAIHERVARVAESVDLLTACHHYIVAGDEESAMRCLADSVIQTMGSGRCGAASRLVDQLAHAAPQPAVVAIKARRLLEEGDLISASRLLASIDVPPLSPTVRAVIRQTRLQLGWRSGDTATMFEALEQIASDDETPPVLRDIAEIFIDTSTRSSTGTKLPSLARRLIRMANEQALAGHNYYAAISLHNAAIAFLHSGSYADAIDTGHRALETYDLLSFPASEIYSVHSVIATASFELARRDVAEEHIALATSTDLADGDAYAEVACLLALTGQRARSVEMIQRAEALERLGRLDVVGQLMAGVTRGLLLLPQNAAAIPHLIDSLPTEIPLDLGYGLFVATLDGLARLLLGDETAAEEIEPARQSADRRGNGRYGIRLSLLTALAGGREDEMRAAVSAAARSGDLALLTVVDAICPRLHLFSSPPVEIEHSIASWPMRWLPALRRQLETGNVPPAHAAAELLSKYGDAEDVIRLRAFDRSYRRSKAPLGLDLARRVSPTIRIEDLGRGMMRVGTRLVPVNKIRRKPASLLMYLVTRPNFTATREQVLEDLWPDGDPGSGANSLNQSLYFVRREIDPWYEVDVSHDYVSFEAELLWLDADLVSVASAEFLSRARSMAGQKCSPTEYLGLVSSYGGQFCPEFEYDEWAITWRSRVHAAYLDFAHRSIGRLAESSELSTARDIADLVLGVDPTALDIERKLVWIYAKLGSTSAAAKQYEHLALGFRADGLEPPSFESIVNRGRPA